MLRANIEIRFASQYRNKVRNKKLLVGQEEKIDKEGPAPAAP